MKRNFYQLAVIATVAIVTIFLSSGCVPEPVPTCKCCQSPVIEKTYGTKTITIYNAFTPDNEAYCDSTVDVLYDSMGRPLPKPAGLCRPNNDTVYNDGINSYFYIKGIEDFYNKLIIRAPGDTTKIAEYKNYSNTTKGQVTFDGKRNDDTTLWGHPRLRQMASRAFEYELILYKDSLRKDTLDIVKGGFCLIRNPTDCEVKGCVGHEEGDPLLK